jgi:hypothetical protein
MGSGEKDKRQASYGESGERWVERAEAKVFENKERYKNFLITPEIIGTHSVLPTTTNYTKVNTTRGVYFCKQRQFTYEKTSMYHVRKKVECKKDYS